MGIPAGALKDDELLHYAAFEPEAAAELSRRISESSLDPGAERAELREEIDRLERNLSDIEDEKETLDSNAREACKLLWRAVEDEEDAKAITDLIKQALDLLE